MGYEITKSGYKAAEVAAKMPTKKWISELMVMYYIIEYEIGVGNRGENFLDLDKSDAEYIIEIIEDENDEGKSPIIDVPTVKAVLDAMKTCVKNGWMIDENELRG